YCYVFDAGSQRLHSSRLALIRDDDNRALAAERNEPAALVTTPNTLFTDSGFRFHETAAGQQRLRREIKALEAEGYKATVSRKKDCNRLVIAGESNCRRLLIVPPVEYPLNPPRVSELPTGKECSLESRMTYWNSDFQIVDIVRELLAPSNDISKLSLTP